MTTTIMPPKDERTRLTTTGSFGTHRALILWSPLLSGTHCLVFVFGI